jgi:two-component system sensor kinase FixL
MPEPDRGSHDHFMRRYQTTGDARIIGIGREVTCERRDGSRFPAWLTVGRIAESAPPRYVGILRDITREKEARATQERLTPIAHELNQPLTAIMAYAQACERQLTAPTPDHTELLAAVREITAEGARAAEMIRKVRRLVRVDADGRRPSDVGELLRELKSLIEADARAHDVIVQLHTDAALPPANVDGAQIQQVVLSLVRNAFEAVAPLPTAKRKVELRSLLADDGDIEIRVSDSGPGVPAEIMDRLFEPFVSSKPAGTGLGLAISRTIVEAHRGTIGVRNGRAAEPRGATFFVKLPAMNGDVV